VRAVEAPNPVEKVHSHRLTVVSLLMIPANLPWLLVVTIVGTIAMNVVGAEEGHLLSEYGTGGWPGFC
jgi:hypothetical protein